MKFSEIPKELEYIKMKDGCIFKPLSDEVKPKDDSPHSKNKEYDIKILCLNDNREYQLSISQSRYKIHIFKLIQMSIENNFEPIIIKITKVGNSGKVYNDYSKSCLLKNHKTECIKTEQVEEELYTEPELEPVQNNNIVEKECLKIIQAIKNREIKPSTYYSLLDHIYSHYKMNTNNEQDIVLGELKIVIDIFKEQDINYPPQCMIEAMNNDRYKKVHDRRKMWEGVITILRGVFI